MINWQNEAVRPCFKENYYTQKASAVAVIPILKHMVADISSWSGFETHLGKNFDFTEPY